MYNPLNHFRFCAHNHRNNNNNSDDDNELLYEHPRGSLSYRRGLWRSPTSPGILGGLRPPNPPGNAGACPGGFKGPELVP